MELWKSERFQLSACQEKRMEVCCRHSDLSQNKRHQRRPALNSEFHAHYLNAKQLQDFETIHFPILSSTLACMRWGLIKLRTINPYRRIRRELRACKSQEIITPAENPSWVKMYKSCRREVCRIVSVNNTSKRAVVRLLYTDELFLQSHLIVCK